MRKNNLLKKTAWIVLSAVLFGTVAGTVMTGIQIASSGMVSQFFAIVASDEDTVKAEGEALPPPEPFPGEKIPETFPQAADIPAPSTDVSEIVEEAMPTVVAVASTAVYQTPDYGYSWFFGGGSQSYEVPSSGSGIIIGKNDTELLIVTNNHVVKDTVSLKITFVDDTAVDAAVKGTDADTDLAVISIPIDQIPQETQDKIAVARLGDSDSLKVGQGVIAINAAKYSSTEVEGIGYAIPVSGVQEILDELMNRKTRSEVEESRRGYLGIQGTTVDEETAATFDMPKGVYVYKILEDGAAAGSELREKDIITKLDGMTVKSMQELQKFLKGYEMGETIELLVQRQEEGRYKEQQIQITLAGLPEGEGQQEKQDNREQPGETAPSRREDSNPWSFPGNGFPWGRMW